MNNHCTHLHAYFGLDAAYCPDCQQTFDSGSRTYGQILKRGSRRESPEDTKLCGSDDTESSFKGFEFGAVGNNAHEHQFTLVWSADCTLLSRCSCGEKRGCDVQELQELLRNCIVVRAEYLLEKDIFGLLCPSWIFRYILLLSPTSPSADFSRSKTQIYSSFKRFRISRFMNLLPGVLAKPFSIKISRRKREKSGG